VDVQDIHALHDEIWGRGLTLSQGKTADDVFFDLFSLLATSDRELTGLEGTTQSGLICTMCGNDNESTLGALKAIQLRFKQQMPGSEDQLVSLSQILRTRSVDKESMLHFSCDKCKGYTLHYFQIEIHSLPQKLIAVHLGRQIKVFLAAGKDHQQVVIPLNNLAVGNRLYGQLIAFLECSSERNECTAWLRMSGDDWIRVGRDSVALDDPSLALQGSPEYGSPWLLFYSK
jgi:hypothetical protein